MRVLNVGGGASRDLPPYYRGWQQDILDIDPQVKPDICLDAKQMMTLPAKTYDAVFCSHNLEHFYAHEVPAVLGGMKHVLKKTGFAQLAVPDLAALFEAVVDKGGDIDATWYRCAGGEIPFHDVLYGWHVQMERGNTYYAHKTGFTSKTLSRALARAGFTKVLTASDGFNLHAYAFLQKPAKAQLIALGAA